MFASGHTAGGAWCGALENLAAIVSALLRAGAMLARATAIYFFANYLEHA